MIQRLATLLIVIATPLTLLGTPEDDQVEARRSALDLAGAWTNDGFQLRDGHWSGAIEEGGARLIRVNLFVGNHYWFTLAGIRSAKRCAITIYNEDGNPLEIDALADGPRAAAGFSPKVSGPYIIKLQSIEGPRGEFALVYSYR